MCAFVCVDAYGGPNRVSGLLKLELQSCEPLEMDSENQTQKKHQLLTPGPSSGSKRKERMSYYGLLFMALEGTVWDSVYMGD